MGDVSTVYLLEDRLYVNLTSRCALRCRFCFKFQERPDFFGHRLVMTRDAEPSVDAVDAAIAAAPEHRELVFCGLGEPLERFDDVVELAARYKLRGGGPVRVNTCGVQVRPPSNEALARLAGCVDSLAISLNAPDRDAYETLCRPVRGGAYEDLSSFIERSKRVFATVILTAVDYPGVDIDACRRLASELGVPFGVRPYSDPRDNAAGGRPPRTFSWPRSN